MTYKAVFTDEFLSRFRLDDNGKTLVLTDIAGDTRAVTLEKEERGEWIIKKTARQKITYTRKQIALWSRFEGKLNEPKEGRRTMKTYTPAELAEILKNHKHWLNEDCDGWEDMRADLSNADLRNAYLSNADLRNADLRNADLRNADLRNAYLSNADLRNADLRNADLRNAGATRDALNGYIDNIVSDYV